jgi:hypothetical protein
LTGYFYYCKGGTRIIIKNIFSNTIINNILVLLQQMSSTSQNDMELVNCANALIHHNNSMLPQCDTDIRNDYTSQNYDSNIAYQLAADYLQVRGGMGLGTTTTTTSSGSGGLTSNSSGGLGSATVTTENTGSRLPLRSSSGLAGAVGAGSSNSSAGSGNSEGTGRNMLQQIPSKPTDFPGNHPSVIQVHVTS